MSSQGGATRHAAERSYPINRQFAGYNFDLRFAIFDFFNKLAFAFLPEEMLLMREVVLTNRNSKVANRKFL